MIAKHRIITSKGDFKAGDTIKASEITKDEIEEVKDLIDFSPVAKSKTKAKADK